MIEIILHFTNTTLLGQFCFNEQQFYLEIIKRHLYYYEFYDMLSSLIYCSYEIFRSVFIKNHIYVFCIINIVGLQIDSLLKA